MPLQKLQFKPGLNREGTDYANEGGWYDGDKIRFRSGFPEKIGGWSRLSDNTFLGTARSLWNWVDLSGNNFLGVGTSLKYYVELGGTYYDVTPIRKIVSPMANNPFATAYSTLNGGISASATSLTLVSGASFSNSPGILKIDSEQIFYTSKAGNTLSGLLRGYNGTTAVSHLTSAVVGCSTITVTDAANGATQNDFVTFSAATAFGGFSTANINAEQQVFNVINTNSYTINISGVFSTSGTSGGGAVVVATYQINTGLDTYIGGTGWGAGSWGRGGWGSGATTSVGNQLRLWSDDNYGQDLVIAPRAGAIYYWKASTGVATRAKLLSDLSTLEGFAGTFVPYQTYQVLSSAIQRFVIAFGANPYFSGVPNTTYDPMLVRWSDQANPYQWVPDLTNQSGEFRLSNGSYIMQAQATRQEILVWTDSCIYSMQYLGPPYVWKFEVLMDNISVMSPNSMITINNVTYWMGVDKFYMYSGRVETLPCSLRQYIFNDINQDQAYQVFCGGNEGYNEVWWFYCSNGSNTVDKYVIYNYLDRVWYYGSMARTAWLDSGIRRYPMATNYDDRVLYHESNVDDVAGTSPAPIDAYVQSSDFDIGDGHNFGFVWRILPDVNFNGSNIDKPAVTMTIKPRQNSGTPYGVADIPTVQSQDNYTVRGVYTIQEFDGQVYTRLRGRQMAFRIQSTGLGVAWQLGTPRIDIRNDGRR
jgi:protein involved in ribonucleotide reduction